MKSLPCKPDWESIARELAYALEVHLYGGQGEIADYTIQEANEFAEAALGRFREADGEANREDT